MLLKITSSKHYVKSLRQKIRNPPNAINPTKNTLNENVKILLSYQKFINRVITVRMKLCYTKKNILLGAVYLFRLPSRSNNGIKFLAIITTVNKGEIHFFLGHKNEETISIKIIMVDVQCIINKARICISLSF